MRENLSLKENLKFNTDGLIPAVIQDEETGKVLTLCYMNQEALDKTLSEQRIYVFRRSRKKVMLKGETSGHIQEVLGAFADCEGNSLLFKVRQKVAACHAGYFTCYYRRVSEAGLAVCEERVFDPGKVY